jgi:transposase
MPPRRRLGWPLEVDLREIVQAIFYIPSSGCQRRALPNEFPLYSFCRRLKIHSNPGLSLIRSHAESLND